MATAFEIKTSYYIEISGEDMQRIYRREDAGTTWDEHINAWSAFQAQYPGVEFSPRMSGYCAAGTREALAVLKYDLEKKAYERG